MKRLDTTLCLNLVEIEAHDPRPAGNTFGSGSTRRNRVCIVDGSRPTSRLSLRAAQGRAHYNELCALPPWLTLESDQQKIQPCWQTPLSRRLHPQSGFLLPTHPISEGAGDDRIRGTSKYWRSLSEYLQILGPAAFRFHQRSLVTSPVSSE